MNKKVMKNPLFTKQISKKDIKRKIKEAVERKIKREVQQSKELQQYLNKVSKIPFLSFREERELTKRIEKGDEKARKKLFKLNLKLVVSIAKKYKALPYFTFLELIFYGEEALEKATIKFDWKKGGRFSPYASWWIRQAIAQAYSYERNKIVTGENLTIFIYRDKKGRVSKITASGIRNGEHIQVGFVGSDEERQKYAQELSEKWKELAKAEEEARKLLKKIKNS